MSVNVVCAKTCYVMQSGEGVAYRFWVRINQELARQRMDQQALVQRSGIPASTINNLRKSTRVPQTRIISALAEALGIDYHEALWLAGHPGAEMPDSTTRVDVREAIRNDPGMSAAQKAMLLEMTELIEQANRQRRHTDAPSEGSRSA